MCNTSDPAGQIYVDYKKHKWRSGNESRSKGYTVYLGLVTIMKFY